MPLLDRIKDPSDLAEFNLSELKLLCSELRQVIIDTVAQNGGHLSPNLGVVELAVALHVVFASPKDKIVWDVGHQCYAHKLLTGRYSSFSSLRQTGGVSGFPRRIESPHDIFDTGHASTSISVALGLLTGGMLNGDNGRVIAVIGDGALTGGLAYEAFSNAGHLNLPLIVILNDNKMSISPNVGSLSDHLSRLSMKVKYQTFRRKFDEFICKIPRAGESIYKFINRLKRAVKAIFYHDNFFVDLGFEYVGPADGHDLRQLIEVLKDVRRICRPVVIHVITQKGRGYCPAENDPGLFHSVPPFSKSAGVLPQSGETWTRLFGTAVLEAGKKDKKIVAITAAMGNGTGLSYFKAAFPERFFDVGIAEAHAVTFAAALAVQGLKPVVAIYSTFFQRAIDSVIHDTALGNLPVVFAVDRAGFVPGDGETHQGLFDVNILRAIPNMTILSPADGSELVMMLNWALDNPSPCVIRYPKTTLPQAVSAFSVPVEAGRGVLAAHKEDAKICIAFTGGLYQEAFAASEILEREGHSAVLYNLRFIKPVDEAYLLRLIKNYRYIAVAEECVRSGGFGEYLTAFIHKNKSAVKIIPLAADDIFYPQATSRSELLRMAGLDGEHIAAAIRSSL